MTKRNKKIFIGLILSELNVIVHMWVSTAMFTVVDSTSWVGINLHITILAVTLTSVYMTTNIILDKVNGR